MYSVFGLGNPLMDLVVHGEHAVLDRLGVHPGTMNLIDGSQRETLLSDLEVVASIPGGSCANTMRGVAWLTAQKGPTPLYAGAVGADELGENYGEQMKGWGVDTRLAAKSDPTGTSTIIVTPDHERTMFTCLSACRHYSLEDWDGEDFPDARYLYFTGYMWDTDNQREAAQAFAAQAKDRGVPVAFDLADPFAVERYRSLFLDWIPGNVEIMFGNRREIALLVSHDRPDRDLIREAGILAPLVVMKTGPNGCLVNHEGDIFASPTPDVPVIDTIGAGDFFAAGFLYGLLQGMDLYKSARLANRMGAAIVAVEGCNLEGLDRSWVMNG